MSSRLLNVALAAGLTVGCTTVSKEALPQAVSMPAVCPVTTAGDTNAVDHLLRQPVPHELIKSSKWKAGNEDANNPEFDHAVVMFKKETARKLGIHLFAAPTELKSAQKELHEPDTKKRPFEDYLKLSRKFIELYGLKLEVASPQSHFPLDSHGPSKSELASDNAKTVVSNIGMAFDMLPVEYAQLGGIKKIILISGAETHNADAFVQSTLHNGRMFVNIARAPGQISSTHVVRHELAHLIDDAECGDNDMFKDRQFQAFNGTMKLYNGNHNDERFPTYVGTKTMKGLHAAWDAEYKFIDARNYKAACKIENDLVNLPQNYVAFSDYHPSVEEDKAEIAAEIPDVVSYYDMLNPANGLVSRKFKFLLTRLYHVRPALATYFAKASSRVQPADSFYAYCLSLRRK